GGGSAGLAYRRAAGDTLTLLDRASHHRTSGHATLRTSMAGKTLLLLDFARAHRTAGEGEPDVLLVPDDDPARAEALAAHLRRQGIEVERAERPFRVPATPYPGYARREEFPAGSFRVRARQPRGRLAVTLLQPETELHAEHSYDISAWSLPYAYGVEAHQIRSGAGGAWRAWDAGEAPAPGEPAEPGYGYLLPPGTATAGGVLRLLRAGGAARVLTESATIDGRAWPAGSWYLPAARDPQLRERVRDAGLGALAVGVRTGRSEEGVDLGSARVRPGRAPRSGLVGGEGGTPTSDRK